jgi:hypothetical protein
MRSVFLERVNIIYDKLAQLLEETRDLSTKVTLPNDEVRLSWYDMCCRRKPRR